MFEKVNPSHPDKCADRIAGALVDLAYEKDKSPRIAVEVLAGHGECNIIAETSVQLPGDEVEKIAKRILGNYNIIVRYKEVPQDYLLARNQENDIKCGDNGIFKGLPTTEEEYHLTKLAKEIYAHFPTDGKYVYSQETNSLIVCQSLADIFMLNTIIPRNYNEVSINPLGDWVGGIDVDCGATNRKLGSDMGNAVSGGGLHGKDLSKADVSVNIYLHLLSERLGVPTYAYCAIGDPDVKVFYERDGKRVPQTIHFKNIVKIARHYVQKTGGFEKLAEWGLV